MVEGGGWRAEEEKGISLLYRIGSMCLQHLLQFLMKTIYSSCYFLDQATLTFCELEGISLIFCQKKHPNMSVDVFIVSLGALINHKKI